MHIWELNMLELVDVEASYGPLKILRGITLRVKPAELIAIIGPNGAGKSTVLKTIFNLVKRDKGHIIFEGEHLEKVKPHDLVKKGIAYVPQGRIVFSSMTVEENLEMGGFTLKENLLKKRVEEVYSKFPVLKEKRKEIASSLSGGQQQMLSVARALMLKPKVLLVDEPSLGLAPKVMKEIFEKLKEINQEGTAILLVEQNAHKALEICTRCIVLDQGKIALEGDKRLIKDKRVKELYLGHY